MSQTDPNLLDPQAIAQAQALGLLARQVVEGILSGEHKSPMRGFAVEFVQHREYAPGDDLRHVDWKVLGRTDRFMLKQYEQETDLTCHLVVDGSASMSYASADTSKLDYARKLAACLAYLVLHQRDAVALSVFDAGRRRQIPRTGNPGSIHTLMAELARFSPTRSGGAVEGLATTLHEIAASTRRRGIVVLLSDLFEDEAAIMSGIAHCRFAGHEVIVFHTLDPAELTFPFTGNVEFEGFETGGKMLTRPTELRKTYLAEFTAFCDRMRLGCETNRCHYIMTNTAFPLAETLTAYLAFRHRVR